MTSAPINWAVGRRRDAPAARLRVLVNATLLEGRFGVVPTSDEIERVRQTIEATSPYESGLWMRFAGKTSITT